MTELEFKEEDPCWIHIGGKNDNPLTKGCVRMKIQLPDFSYPLYLIEVDSHIETLFFVRDGRTMSNAPDRPIGLFRGLVNETVPESQKTTSGSSLWRFFQKLFHRH